jgi:uncharacterized protein YlxP (DUF503 family)
MVVGVLQLSLRIPEAMSLKDKRRAIKSLKDRLSARHNVSVAEVDRLDDIRSSILAVGMVSNDRRFTDSCLSKIAREVERYRSVLLADYSIEMF